MTNCHSYISNSGSCWTRQEKSLSETETLCTKGILTENNILHTRLCVFILQHRSLHLTDVCIIEQHWLEYLSCSSEADSYLWEVIPSYQNTVGGPLQYLPHAVIKAQRCPVQGAIYLTPVQPRPPVEKKKYGETVGMSLKRRWKYER